MKTVCGILQQVHLMMQRREGSPTDPLQCFKAGLLRRSLVFLKGAYVSIHVTQNVPWRLVVAMRVVSSCGHWEPGWYTYCGTCPRAALLSPQLLLPWATHHHFSPGRGQEPPDRPPAAPLAPTASLLTAAQAIL